MSISRPAPLSPGATVTVRWAAEDRDGVRGELLGFGEAPSPHVLILIPGGEEVAVFTGPGVEIYASALTSGGGPR